jgi:alanine dehydrogenase
MFSFSDGMYYNKAFQDLILVLSKYSNKRVSLNASQQETLNLALTALSTVSLSVKQTIIRSEFSVLEKKTQILASFLDLAGSLKSILNKFTTSVNTDTTEARANAEKIILLLSEYSNLIIDIGKYSFVYNLSATFNTSMTLNSLLEDRY